MNRVEITVSIIIALLIGSFLGYYFTNSHYVSKEASEADSAERIICSLELREGNIGQVKSTYLAIMEGRDRSACNEYIPTSSLPDDTELFWLGGL